MKKFLLVLAVLVVAAAGVYYYMNFVKNAEVNCNNAVAEDSLVAEPVTVDTLAEDSAAADTVVLELGEY